jgi:hypothetical protein
VWVFHPVTFPSFGKPPKPQSARQTLHVVTADSQLDQLNVPSDEPYEKPLSGSAGFRLAIQFP